MNTTEVREAEEVERLGLALAPLAAVIDGLFAELDQPRLVTGIRVDQI